LDEQILIEQAKNGDQAAFKTIVETWQSLVYNTALGIVQNAEDAEDVTQEVFVKVHKSLKSFKGESKLSTWLYRITVTKSLDHERKKKTKKRVGVTRSIEGADDRERIDPPDFHHPGVALDQKENAAILFRVMKQLPENQRIAFTLHKLEGLSYAEISEVMKVSVSAVESLMHRAKANLQKLLIGYYK
jgi:RNA polymerase sigma factor (sigma-70 family)